MDSKTVLTGIVSVLVALAGAYGLQHYQVQRAQAVDKETVEALVKDAVKEVQPAKEQGALKTTVDTFTEALTKLANNFDARKKEDAAQKIFEEYVAARTEEEKKRERYDSPEEREIRRLLKLRELGFRREVIFAAAYRQGWIEDRSPPADSKFTEDQAKFNDWLDSQWKRFQEKQKDYEKNLRAQMRLKELDKVE